jgi:hypothetical protein
MGGKGNYPKQLSLKTMVYNISVMLFMRLKKFIALHLIQLFGLNGFGGGCCSLTEDFMGRTCWGVAF